MKCLLPFILFFVPFLCYGEKRFNIDSLENIFKTSNNATLKFEICKKAIEYYKKPDFNKALFYCNYLLELYKQKKNPIYIVEHYNTKSMLHNIKFGLDSAINMRQKALYFTNLLPNELQNNSRKRILSKIGSIYLNHGDYERALEWISKAESIPTDTSSLSTSELMAISSLYGDLVTLNIRFKNNDNAKKYAHKSLSISKKLNLESVLVASYYQLANVYFTENPRQSLEYLDSAYYYNQRKVNGNEYWNVKINGLRSSILLNENKLEDCVYYGKSSFSQAKTLSENKTFALYEDLPIFSASILMKAYASKKESDSSKYYIDFLKKKQSYLKDPFKIEQIQNDIANVYFELQDFQKAATSYKENIILKDSILSREYVNKINELTVKYESQKKEQELVQHRLEAEKAMQLAQLKFEYSNKQAQEKSSQEKKLLLIEEENKRKEIEAVFATKQKLAAVEFDTKQRLLKAENEKTIAQKNLSIKEKNYWNLMLAGVSGTLLLLGTLAFRQNRIKQKTNQQLSEKNKKIETLLRELHHRTKNNMQVISSLLSLQSRKINDTALRSSFEDSKNRINAMSLIHSNLYREEDASSLDLKKYIDTLVDSLTQSYAHSPVRINKDMAPLMLKVDDAIPIGLVVNELMTNALKYGTSAAQPQICILLQTENQTGFLQIKDNGTRAVDMNNSNDSFGLKLVHMLTKQIEGTINFEYENGLRAQLSFPIKQ